jgi:Glycosyl hydrolase family 10
MLSFVVFDSDGVDARHFPPRHAYVTALHEVPTQGVVRLAPGRVECDKANAANTAGLAVQIEVQRPHLPDALAKLLPTPHTPVIGLLVLQTTLLPDRARPYLLAIELARHQIMLLLNKLEDWQLTELPPEHPVLQQFELARDNFTAALVAQNKQNGASDAAHANYHPEANRTAAQALSLALEAGEELALIQAESLPAGAAVVAPGSGHVTLPGVPLIGCAISPGQMNETLAKAGAASCDFLTMPMRWVDVEPVEGKYNFTTTDRWIEWAVRTAKLPLVGGPVVDLRPRSAPDWLFIWENDYDTLRDLVFEHIQAVVTRYRKTISRWTVASGLHVNTNFKISFEQILDLTRLSVMLIKKLHPTARVQLELQQPWGEYLVQNKRSIPPYVYAEAVLTTQLPVDAIALRVQMGHAEPGLATRDMLSLSAMLDKYAALEKPLFITAVGAPSQTIAPKPYVPRVGAEATVPYEPGYWRSPWSESQQALWMTHAMSIMASKPFVQGICWHDLYDAPGDPASAPEMPFGGLIDRDGKPKQSLQRLADIRRCLREGKSPLSLLKPA